VIEIGTMNLRPYVVSGLSRTEGDDNISIGSRGSSGSGGPEVPKVPEVAVVPARAGRVVSAG
jgi:hypothetical protein